MYKNQKRLKKLATVRFVFKIGDNFHRKYNVFLVIFCVILRNARNNSLRITRFRVQGRDTCAKLSRLVWPVISVLQMNYAEKMHYSYTYIGI